MTKRRLRRCPPAALWDEVDFVRDQFVYDCIAFSARLLAIRDGYAKVMGVSGPQYMIMISVAILGPAG